MYTLDNDELILYVIVLYILLFYFFFVLGRDHGSVLTRPLKYIMIIFADMIVPIYELLGPLHGHQCCVNIAHHRLPYLIYTMCDMCPWFGLIFLPLKLKDRGSNFGQTV